MVDLATVAGQLLTTDLLGIGRWFRRDRSAVKLSIRMRDSSLPLEYPVGSMSREDLEALIRALHVGLVPDEAPSPDALRGAAEEIGDDAYDADPGSLVDDAAHPGPGQTPDRADSADDAQSGTSKGSVEKVPHTKWTSIGVRAYRSPAGRTWGVFLLCLVVSGAGVWLSFSVFGVTLTGTRLWQLSLVISAFMLLITYAGKYAHEATRSTFTPLDILQTFTQGFLWPSAWPALAHLTGIQPVGGPGAP